MAASMSLFRSLGLGPASRRVLENAFGTSVMNELSAGDQSFLHGDFAPGAQAVGQVGGGRFCIGHGPALSMSVKNLVNRPLLRRSEKSRKKISPPSCR